MIRKLPVLRHEPFLLGTGLPRFIDELFRDFDRIGFDTVPSVGRTDVYEKDKTLVFETELPGMKKEEIDIKLEDGTLVVSGETKRSEDVKEEHYFRVGRQYGRVQRCFPLPDDLVDKNAIRATLEDGILKVTVPLAESIKEKEQMVAAHARCDITNKTGKKKVSFENALTKEIQDWVQDNWRSLGFAESFDRIK